MKLAQTLTIAVGSFAMAAGLAMFATSTPAVANPTCPPSCGGGPSPSPSPAGGPILTTVGQSQSDSGQSVKNDAGNKATVDGSAFQSATGNVGNNVAGGNSNQQDNEAYIEYGNTQLDIDASSPQSSSGNGVSTSGSNSASVSGNAFQYATGNIGNNVAAGNLNQQSNDAVILDNDNLLALTMGTSQNISSNSFKTSGGNSASLGDNAFANASGNIGSNTAAGNANQQANQLVVNSNP